MGRGRLTRVLLWLARAVAEAMILFVLYGIMANIVDDRCSQAVSAQEEKMSPERERQLLDYGAKVASEARKKRTTNEQDQD